VLNKIECVASNQYPNLSEKEATEQMLSYILNSIIMDFHPEDLFAPAINKSLEVDIKALKVQIPRFVAFEFAKHSISTNRKSYTNLIYELRKRIFKKYQMILKSRTPRPSDLDNSFGYPPQ